MNLKKTKKIIITGIWLLVMLWFSFAPLTVDAQTIRWFWATVGVEWVLVPWAQDGNKDDSLLYTIQTAINRVLGMLSFIALVLCLYAWFMMMTSGWDSKKYGDGFKILKNAGIWLAIIALSWLIVSLIFRLIDGSIGGVNLEGSLPAETSEVQN